MSKKQNRKPLVENDPNKKFSLEILLTIKKYQMANGVRFSDYDRYSKYCTKRMQRIRKKVNFHYGAKFKLKQVTPEIINDVRFLEMVLLCVERAWAQSLSLKEVDPYTYPRAKHHAASRLRKAIKWSQQLVILCTARGDQRTILESESYSSWLYANELLEHEEWNVALENLLKAKNIYTELSKSKISDQQRSLYIERLNEIEPSIRYCKFNISQEGGLDLEHVMKLKLEADGIITRELTRSYDDFLLNHLDEYVSFIDNDAEDMGKKLILFPPVLEPISCKPLLLDLALERVQFPDLTQRTTEKKGFLSGWWG